MLAADEAAPDFRLVFEFAPYPSAVLCMDPGFTVAAASDRYLAGLGLSRSEIVGRPLDEVLASRVCTKARRELLRSLKRVVGGKGCDTIECDQDAGRRGGGGDSRSWRSVSMPLAGGDGRTFILHQLDDITESKRARRQLSLAARVFHNIRDGVIVTDERARILSVNPAFTEITGYSEAEVIGRTPGLLCSEDDGPNYYRELWAVLLRDGRWEGEMWNRRKNGEAALVWLTISRVVDGDGEKARYVGIFNDITESRRKDERIRRLAFHDPLTGLPNRALLFDRVERAIAFAARDDAHFGVMFVDLDHFKAINDALGHHVGDGVLREVARRLIRCLRQSDTVARIGGDEFVILIERAADLEDYASLAQSIVSSVAEPVLTGGHNLHIGASVGIACFPDDGRLGADLMQNADAAMYAAKAAGRSTYRFFRALAGETAAPGWRLGTALRNALPNGEFELHYQPRVSLGSQAPCGFEALLRWRHPQLGLIPPADFIPLAESMGLIAEIGAWVIGEACRQRAEWQAQGLGRMRIAVTVAGRQLQQGDLVATIVGLTDHYGISPGDLEIKLTESVILAHPERVTAVVAGLRAIGVSIAIDDFGTGDSTLACLRRMPIDSLSIDRSLTRTADCDDKDAQIVRGILALGRTLDVSVIAEGVETESQSDFLRACGCTLGQGYLYARPAPAAQVEAWLRTVNGGYFVAGAAKPH